MFERLALFAVLLLVDRFITTDDGQNEGDAADSAKDTAEADSKEAAEADSVQDEDTDASPRVTAVSDLTKIDGIGAKIQSILNAGGIHSLADLAKASVDELKQILENAGPRYRLHDPTTWPQQADLLARGKTEEFVALKKELKGGRRAPSGKGS